MVHDPRLHQPSQRTLPPTRRTTTRCTTTHLGAPRLRPRVGSPSQAIPRTQPLVRTRRMHRTRNTGPPRTRPSRARSERRHEPRRRRLPARAMPRSSRPAHPARRLAIEVVEPMARDAARLPVSDVTRVRTISIATDDRPLCRCRMVERPLRCLATTVDARMISRFTTRSTHTHVRAVVRDVAALPTRMVRPRHGRSFSHARVAHERITMPLPPRVVLATPAPRVGHTTASIDRARLLDMTCTLERRHGGAVRSGAFISHDVSLRPLRTPPRTPHVHDA